MSNLDADIAEIKKDVAEIKKLLQEGASFDQKKKHEFATSVRDYMLKHVNISFIDDKIEGDVYEFVADRIWDMMFH